MEECSVVEGCSVGLERIENSRIASAKTFGKILLTNHCQDQTCDGEFPRSSICQSPMFGNPKFKTLHTLRHFDLCSARLVLRCEKAPLAEGLHIQMHQNTANVTCLLLQYSIECDEEAMGRNAEMQLD